MVWFGWVHFSDPQVFDGQERSAEWVLPELVASDLLSLRQAYSPWNLILITGDVARTGQLAEYDAADHWLSRVLKPLRESEHSPLVAIVPGNHDFDRGAAVSDSDYMAKRLFDVWETQPRVRDEFWAGDSPLREQVQRGFANYHHWVTTRGEPAFYNRNATLHQGLLPGDFSATVIQKNFRLGIIGLNTAFVDDASHYGELHSEQFATACGGDFRAWCQERDGWLLLTHHPPELLSSRARDVLSREIDTDRLIAHFCSGTHASDPGVRWQGERLTIASRGLTTGRSYERTAGYSTGVITSAQRPVQIHIHRRVFQPERVRFTDEDPAQGALTYAVPRSAGLESATADARDLDALPDVPVLEWIEIRDFRCIDSLTIRFRRDSQLPGQWTCIAGINGSGKSSVLQALCVTLLGPLAADLGSRELQRMRRREPGRVLDAAIRVRLRLRDETHTLTIKITDRGLLDDASEAGRRIWRDIANQVLVSYGASRNLSSFIDGRHEPKSPLVQQQMTLFDPLSQVASAELLLAMNPDKRSPHLVPLLTQLVAEVFDGEVALRSNGQDISFAVAEQHIAALELPDGFRSALAWLVDLCATFCDKSPSRASSRDLADIQAIVLIDEIDLHLHPSLQRVLVPRLRRALPGVQWVVTTHSPFLLSSFDRSELVLLERSSETGVRELDRQILAFSMDEIYQWLMDTPPSSGVIDHELDDDGEASSPARACIGEESDEWLEQVRHRYDQL